MKAILSSTFDPKYFFLLPITTWSWNRLGVGVECIVPDVAIPDSAQFVLDTLKDIKSYIRFTTFKSTENQQATYAQCSRLFGGTLDLDDDEELIVGDVDMAMLSIPEGGLNGEFTIYGHDLVPEGQFPMCYISALKKDWAETFHVEPYRLQDHLDDLLGDIDCGNMRGNYWAKDQETAYQWINNGENTISLVNRAKPGTQFATKRLDRDDAFILERDIFDVIDFHMPRPGFEDANFNIILTILQKKYPFDDFSWMVQYRNEYIKLL